MIVWIVYLTFLSFVSIMILYMLRHYLFSFTALYGQKGQPRYTLHGLSYTPSVSVLIPAQDEEAVLGRLLHKISEFTYPKDKMDVIVIDDASTDNTGKIADEFAEAYNYFRVIHRRVGVGGKGKSRALNAALDQTSNDIVICFDADYDPQIDIIEKLTAYFVDPEVGAVQGRVTVFNENATWVSRLVTVERIGGYRVDQLARDSLGLVPQYGGTVCAVRRDLLEFLGGWDPDALTEDTDMTFRVYLSGYKIRYVNDAESYEEAVETWRAYWRQRYRWAKGHMQCFFKHAIPFMRSRNLRFKEKFDGLLLLGVYFVPVFVAMSWFLGAVIFFFGSTAWFESIWALFPVFLYSSVGNFALFFEVGVGIYLDKRVRISWLIPLLLFSFVLNSLICSKALLDLAFSRVVSRKFHPWGKTLHKGDRWERF